MNPRRSRSRWLHRFGSRYTLHDTIMKSFVLVGLASFLLTCASRPPPRQPLAAPAQGSIEPTPAAEPQIRVELVDGPVPWTHLEPDDRDNAFQFAIVTDRTGGARPGVFASAVDKLNLLKPELVVSVGDLIEGYTEDRSQLKREWDHFDAMVQRLEAPFFYVAGNHDMTNDVMRDVWRERYGPNHYYFIYKNVLFVCLNSMDGELHKVSKAQVDWLRGVLASHEDVSWTLLFLHTPLWDDSLGYPGNSVGYRWDDIEQALGERRYTAFAGHHHRYVKQQRNSHKLFTLATTGGVSRLRGPAYGEFDHVMWVTMTEDGPQIANLFLDGIWDENVRTDELRSLQHAVLADSALEPSPIYYDGTFRRGTSRVRVRNDQDIPFDVVLESRGDSVLSVTPEQVRVSAPPNSVEDQDLEVVASTPVRTNYAALPFEWSARALGGEGQALQLKGSSTIPLVSLIPVPKSYKKKKIDGVLDDWPKLPIAVDEPAQVLRDAKAYRGPEDAHFRVGFSQDRTHLYVAVQVFDDSVAAKKDELPWNQDGVEVRVDARPDPVRAHSGGAGDGQEFLAIAMSPSPSAEEDWYAPEHLPKPNGVEAATVRNETGFITEIAIARSTLDEAQGSEAKLVRVNVAVNDGDSDGQSQLWWHPDWRTDEDQPGSGTLRLRR